MSGWWCRISPSPLLLLILISALSPIVISSIISGGNPNYGDALSKSILFFQAQRSGKLPSNQTISWRFDSGLSDGSSENVDLSGGYYDAGDNIKFGLPMAFTTTMLAWSVLEFGRHMPGGECDNAREAIRWVADYLLKASSALPDALYVQVGDPVADHNCWQRPEDTNTARNVYKVTPTNPGSDVAGETAAALAAASLVFRHIDIHYSNTLSTTAEKAFAFADKYRGKYSDSLSSLVCPFYCSYSGYLDELQWAAAWLYKATENSSYLDYARSVSLEHECSYHSEAIAKFREQAERFICSVLPNSPSITVQHTPGGLMYKMDGSNLQYVTSSTFLLTVYAKFLKASNKTFSCGSVTVDGSILRQHAKRQVDYILGDNSKGMSYMVGYGDRYPLRIHHRGSSLPNLKLKPEAIGCDDGFQSYYSANPNPNILIGAVVGGPDQYDEFYDDRNNYAQSEPATYINAPLVGILSYFAASFKS
ncbi:hypothetical protein L1049_019547 [Liquidambar formosana]|uniref:Endoglucanase n=1 Tax=Liquidambar formosana TaxID=63359 RepID=A0AAP0S8B3_LIQFO